jgi:MerR HTH family regulatory protein
MDKEFLERCLADGMSLPQIGRLVGKDPSTVGYWVKKHGLKANGADKYAPLSGIAEEVLEIMVDDELTLEEMAQELECSVSTIRHWLEKYGLQPTRGGRRRKTTNGPRFAVFDCSKHGRTEFVLEGRGYYRCKRCRGEAVAKRRRVVKHILVREAGGACVLCGYDRCPAALGFHHLDPSTKSFNLSLRGVTKSIDRIREEAAKCILLCANCHAEVEVGFVQIPQDNPSRLRPAPQTESLSRSI